MADKRYTFRGKAVPLFRIGGTPVAEYSYAYNFTGKRYDTGNKLGYLKAVVEFALRREDLGEGFREYLKSLPL